MADFLSMLFGDAMLTGEERLRKQRAEAQAAALRGGQVPPPVQPPAPPQMLAQATPSPVPTEGPAPQMPAPAQNRPQALPKAVGGIQAATQPPQTPVEPPAASPEPLDQFEQRQQDLYRQMQTAMQPPDLGPAKAEYEKRAASGGHALALALAAQEAGDEFRPIQAHYLKQAAAAKEPMRVHGGTLTETGFIEDPGYAQELKLKQINAQIAANDRIIASNATAEAKREAERRSADLKRELQQNQLALQSQIAAQSSADRRYAVDVGHGDRQAALGAKAGKLTAKEQSDLDAHTAMQTGLANAITSLQGLKGGGVTSYLQGLVQEKLPGGETIVSGHRDPQLNAAIQQLTYVTDAIRHDRFGSALTNTEKASAAQYLPSPYDSPPRMLEKARGLQKLVDDNNQRLVAKGMQPEGMPPGMAPPQGPQAGVPAATRAPQQPAPKGPVRVNTPAEAAKLPPGTPFITPDGQRRVRQ